MQKKDKNKEKVLTQMQTAAEQINEKQAARAAALKILRNAEARTGNPEMTAAKTIIGNGGTAKDIERNNTEINPFSVSVYSKCARLRIGEFLRPLLAGMRQPPVVLCIGSDRVTGDALGPLTGFLLTTKYNVRTFVYGTLDLPVTALNLADSKSFIARAHHGRRVIAVDASLGREEDVGTVRVRRGGIYPGAATDKTLPKVGDFSITAVVAGGGFAAEKKLQAARLAFIWRIADAIAGAVSDSLILTR